jgi:chromosome segregation ATPase
VTVDYALNLVILDAVEYERLEAKIAHRDEALSVVAFDLAEAHQAIDDEKARAESLERYISDALKELDYRATVIRFMATARDEALGERDKVRDELARTVEARDQVLEHLGDACHDRDRLEDELAKARAVTRTAEAQVDAIGDRLYRAHDRIALLEQIRVGQAAAIAALNGRLPS